MRWGDGRCAYNRAFPAFSSTYLVVSGGVARRWQHMFTLSKIFDVAIGQRFGFPHGAFFGVIVVSKLSTAITAAGGDGFRDDVLNCWAFHWNNICVSGI